MAFLTQMVKLGDFLEKEYTYSSGHDVGNVKESALRAFTGSLPVGCRST